MTEEREIHQRPAPFPPGMDIGLHLKIEQLLTTGSNRAYYLANNHTPRWYTQICWGCGHKHNPPTAQSCAFCQAPLTKRRFLMVARWDADVAAYHAYATMQIRSSLVNTPVVLYQYRGQLLAFHEIGRHETMLVDAPAPLHTRTLLSTCWCLAGALMDLAQAGVRLGDIRAESVLIQRTGARLFDPDVVSIGKRPPEPAHDRWMTAALARLMLQYTPVNSPHLAEFFRDAAAGSYPGMLAFQRSLQGFARDREFPAVGGHAVAVSSVGRKRSANEDAWSWRQVGDYEVFALADGMGGYHAGDRASQTAVETVLSALAALLPNGSPDKHAALIQQAIQRANQAVRKFSTPEKPCGTTLVLAVLDASGRGHVANVGDSRGYILSGHKLTPITEDHSMVAAMVATGKITREEARTHPRANVLLQFLGGGTEVEADVEPIALETGEQLLLCSDGLWGEVPELELEGGMNEQVENWRRVNALVARAKEAGGKDNITALLVTR